MSAFRAGHLRKALVAAAKVVGGSNRRMCAALDLNTGNPQLINALHLSGVFLFRAVTDLDLAPRLFSCPSNFLYGGSP